MIMRQRGATLLLVAFAAANCRTATEPGDGPGSVVWRAAGVSMAAPAVADTTVYFGTSDHAITALDTRTGQVRWRTASGETAGLAPGQNVLVVGSLVALPDLGLYAFDRATGARRWSFHPPSGDTPGRFIIATDGVRIFTGSAAGYAYAVDARTGTSLWTTAIAVDGNSVVADPVADQGSVFVTLRHWTNPTTGGVVALDAVTGAIRWQRNFVPSGPGQGAGSYGRVGLWHGLVIASADDGAVYGLDRNTGAIVWVSPRPADEGGFNDQRPVAVVGDVVAVGSDRTVLTGLDAATGQQRWTIRSEHGSIDFEMGSDDRYLYLPYVNLQMSAIDLSSGTIAWTSGSLPIGEYVAYAVSDGSQVYAPGLHGLFALRR
jgi:outer membrane protein assembly factor BamB